MAKQKPNDEIIDDTHMGCPREAVVAIAFIVVIVAVFYFWYERF